MSRARGSWARGSWASGDGRRPPLPTSHHHQAIRCDTSDPSLIRTGGRGCFSVWRECHPPTVRSVYTPFYASRTRPARMPARHGCCRTFSVVTRYSNDGKAKGERSAPATSLFSTPHRPAHPQCHTPHGTESQKKNPARGRARESRVGCACLWSVHCYGLARARPGRRSRVVSRRRPAPAGVDSRLLSSSSCTLRRES